MTNDFSPGDTCPICGEGTMSLKTNQVIEFEYKCRKTPIVCRVWTCDRCSEGEFIHHDDNPRIEDKLKEVRDKADAEDLAAGEVLYRVTHRTKRGWNCFGLVVKDDKVVRIAPISRKYVGKPAVCAISHWQHQGATVERIG